jgi:hypothetical protein
VFVPFNQAGLAANTLLSGAFSTPVEVEPVETVETTETEALAAVGEEAP